MAKRIGGFRRKTRDKLNKSPRMKGKISIRKYLQEFQQGDVVCLKIEPSFHKGMFFPRYYGKTGTIDGKQGKCYKVSFVDGHKEKMLLVHPLHLVKMREQKP